MDSESEFQIRPGRIRSKSAQRLRPFVFQALAAAQKAGATVRNGRVSRNRSRFGRGRQATQIANRLLTNQSRLTTVKARVVRHRGSNASLKAHLRYLQREGVTKDGEKATLFGPERDSINATEFAETCTDDRHHFRFIVAPEDAAQMADLKRFTRDLMNQAETDLGTGLDWVGVSHWNTEHPHVHIIVRGVTDLGEDLVISRDYIKEGLRARAQGLVTDELGPKTDIDIRETLHRQVEAERYTQLDRQLLFDAKRSGYIDLAPNISPPDAFQALKAGRMRKLEALGLADQFAPGQWLLSENTEATLRELGERGDIIKRLHRSLADAKLERPAQSLVLTRHDPGTVSGRLLDRGLDDELRGTAYIVIDGTDGRTRHVTLPNLEATGDSPLGSIISVRFPEASGAAYPTVRVESDLNLSAQINANGATWLDRQLVKQGRESFAQVGFGAEVGQALEQRLAHLNQAGLTRGESLEPLPDLLRTLRVREMNETISRLQNSGAKSVRAPAEGEHVSGVYSRRLNLASGRFAVLDDGMGFQLVPWTPKLEQHLGQPVTGFMKSSTSVSWDLGRSRSMGIEI